MKSSRLFRILFRLGLIGAGTLAILLGLRLVFFRGPALAPEPLPDQPIIDLHCHVAGIGAQGSGCFVSPELAESFKFPIYLKAFGVTEEDVRARGDRLIVEELSKEISRSQRVKSAVVLALDGVVTDGELDREKTQVYVPNEFIAEETRKTENLLFGASINPYRKDALSRLERALELGAVLMKWIPSIMEIDPADPELTPFYLKMKEAGLPLLSHTGQERSFMSARDDLCDPVRLELPLSLGLDVIAAHIATTGHSDGEAHFDRILPLFTRYPNLYADVSSLTQLNKLGYLEKALKDGRGTERLVYGTDWPLQFFPMVSPFYQALHLKIGEMFEIQSFENPWDRDVHLKQKMGLPAEAFLRGEKLLRLSPKVD